MGDGKLTWVIEILIECVTAKSADIHITACDSAKFEKKHPIAGEIGY
jgi:hypothetical protein